MTEPDPRADHPVLPGEEPLGGEPACDLHRVCNSCGALEDGPPAPVCGRCGSARAG